MQFLIRILLNIQINLSINKVKDVVQFYIYKIIKYLEIGKLNRHFLHT